MNQPLFYIWSFEHDGWWMPNWNGYTQDFHSAGKYTAEEALKICTEGNYAFNNGYAMTPNEAMVPVLEQKVIAA